MTVIVAPRRSVALVSENGLATLRFSDVLEQLSDAVTALTNGVDRAEANEDEYTTIGVIETRTFDAKQAAGDISVTYDQAEIENLRDSILVLADVLGTVIDDLKSVGIVP